MSKKKAKRAAEPVQDKKVELLTSIGAIRNRDFDDDEGFQILSPTEKGKKDLEEIRMRRSKKSEAKTVEVQVDVRPYEKYSPAQVKKMMDKVIEKIKEGKFGKALDLKNNDLVSELVDAFTNMEADMKNFTAVSQAVSQLLTIGKSFYEYDEKHRSFIDDTSYDGMVARYRKLGLVEPTGIVPATGKSKVGIKYPTLHNNMDKAYIIREGDQVPKGVKETDSVEAFLKRIYTSLGISSEENISLELSPKIDGVSVNGTISGDMLVNPQTRGDETASVAIIGLNGIEVGEGMTEKEFGIQYEAFVTDEDRLKASEYMKLDTPYVSCRHAISGIIGRLCSGDNDDLLQFISLYPIESAGLDGTYAERMDYLSNFGIVPDDMIERKTIKGNLKELISAIMKNFEKYEKKREKLSYAIDGMVITLADDEYQSSIGREGRTNLYQIALKFDPATATAVVKGIHLDTGKKGFRTIQVDLEHPIYLDGVKYDHVPVLSAGLFDELGLREGSKVTVHRVGDVIPSISVDDAGKGKKLDKPAICPDCGGWLTIKNKKLFCGNAICRGNLAGRIAGLFDALGMEGYNDAFAAMIAEKFNPNEIDPDTKEIIMKDDQSNVVISMKDLFNLTPKAFKKAGINTKAAAEFRDTLIKAVAATPDYVILGSIGIPDLGPARAKLILRQYKGDWNKFISELTTFNGYRMHAAAVGEAVALSISKFLNDFTAKYMITEDLKEFTKHMKKFTKNFDTVLKVGHTGAKLSQKALEVCEALKFEVVDGKTFDILITASMDSTSDKMVKAKKKGLPIFTEEGFLKRYEPEANLEKGKKSNSDEEENTTDDDEPADTDMDTDDGFDDLSLDPDEDEDD